MPTTTSKSDKRSVQVTMPADLIVTIDQIAADQLLSRSAWVRRTICKAAQSERWLASLDKSR
jgi:metal-responsive CopG/Arc/MetJ family transcriptional regulator